MRTRIAYKAAKSDVKAAFLVSNILPPYPGVFIAERVGGAHSPAKTTFPSFFVINIPTVKSPYSLSNCLSFLYARCA